MSIIKYLQFFVFELSNYRLKPRQQYQINQLKVWEHFLQLTGDDKGSLARGVLMEPSPARAATSLFQLASVGCGGASTSALGKVAFVELHLWL